MTELQRRGYTTSDEPGQEDFGWYFTVDVGGKSHCVIIGFQPNEEATGDCWIGSVERNVGFLKSILGKRDQNIYTELLDVMDSVLRETPDTTNVEWSKRF